jgi:hypothetical protein
LPKKILKYGTGQQWLSIYGLFVIRPNLYGLHGYLALEIVHGAGERFSVYVVWFRNLSTSVLEMGVLFLYGLIMASIRPLSGVR